MRRVWRDFLEVKDPSVQRWRRWNDGRQFAHKEHVNLWHKSLYRRQRRQSHRWYFLELPKIFLICYKCLYQQHNGAFICGAFCHFKGWMQQKVSSEERSIAVIWGKSVLENISVYVCMSVPGLYKICMAMINRGFMRSVALGSRHLAGPLGGIELHCASVLSDHLNINMSALLWAELQLGSPSPTTRTAGRKHSAAAC